MNGKVTADDIKLTDETIDKFTKEYEMVLTRANDLYDLMEENMVKKPAVPGNREAGAEQPPAVGDNPTSVLVIQPSFKPLQNLGKETTPIDSPTNNITLHQPLQITETNINTDIPIENKKIYVNTKVNIIE